jgi:hypothetical protein
MELASIRTGKLHHMQGTSLSALVNGSTGVFALSHLPRADLPKLEISMDLKHRGCVSSAPPCNHSR